MGKLSVRAIECAKPKNTPYKLIVGNGLQLRVGTNGSKIWLCRYHVNGHERQYRFPEPYRAEGGEGFLSLKDAETKAAMIRAYARRGIDYQVKLAQDQLAEAKRLADEEAADAARRRQEQADNLTVGDMFHAWLADGVRRKDGNAELIRSFNADVLPRIGHLAVRDTTEHDLRKALRTMVERGVNRLAVITAGNLTQLFRWAEKRQPWRRLLAMGNPMDLIEIEKIVSADYDIRNRRERILSPAEIAELYSILVTTRAAYESAPDKRTATRPLERTTEYAIWIMLATLVRVSELLQARWEHVDFDRAEWFIPATNTKGSIGKQSDLLVYLSPFVLDYFRRLHKLTGDTNWCFPATYKDDEHLHLKTISKQIGDRQIMFKKDRQGNPRQSMTNRSRDGNVLVLSGGRNGAWTAHDLRRTGSTMMQSLGIPLDIIDRCQNHVLPGSKTRRHYLHHDYAAEKRDAWQRLGARIELLIHPTDNVTVINFR